MGPIFGKRVPLGRQRVLARTALPQVTAGDPS